MIGITTEKGELTIVARIKIPNGKAWDAQRTSRLMAHIEQFVFAAELADKPCGINLADRKPNFKSGLVIDA